MMVQLPMPHLERFALDGIPLLTDEALFEACGVRIAFAGRAGGESEGVYASLNTGAHVDDDPRSVAMNRRRLLNAIGANGEPLIVPNQLHGTHIAHVGSYVDIGRVDYEAAEGADAVQIDVVGLAALLNFADCLPLIIVAPSGHFAVVHAGWRGAVDHIASKAVRSLAQDGADPSAFNAYIGPHIGVECFEVGEDVALKFVGEFGDEVAPDKRHVDLSQAVRRDLESAGMIGERIADCAICTKCHPDEYFSYRATGGKCGRQAAIAYRGRAWEA